MTIKYEINGGNIFADIGVENPEEALVKAELVTYIHDIIKKKKLTQKKAATLYNDPYKLDTGNLKKE